MDRVSLCLHFLVLWDCSVQLLFGNIVALNPGLGDVRNVAPDIISHEQTQSESAVFKLWVLYFQRISFQIIKRSQQLSRGGAK